MLLAAVGHTAVHVADWGDVVLVVDGAVAEVDDEVDVLLLHPTAATESAASVAAAANRRFIMISSCHQVHGLGRAKGPEHRYGYPRRAGAGQLAPSKHQSLDNAPTAGSESPTNVKAL
jgi:hypothetical protein